MPEWKDKFIKDVLSYDNDTLFVEYLYICNGDECEGGFTKDGEFRLTVLETELIKRLKEHGFLTSGFNINDL